VGRYGRMPGPERLEGGLADADALDLEQVVGQFQAVLGRVVEDSLLQQRSQVDRRSLDDPPLGLYHEADLTD
jgi:hypothetical protein